MAQIDNSIYFQQEVPDILGNVEKGLRLRDLIDTKKLKQKELADEQAVKEAYKRNLVTNPDGTTTLNKDAVLSDLYKVDPIKAEAEEQKLTQADREKTKAKLEEMSNKLTYTGQLFGGVKDQFSYESVRSNLISAGLFKEGELPPQYNPIFVQDNISKALSLKEQLDQKWKQKDYDQKERELNAKKNKEELEAKEKKEKKGKVSLSQAKQMGLYNSGLKAEEQYNKAVSGKGWSRFDPSSNFNIIDKNDWAPNFLKSKESIEAQAAQDRWVESFLRDASGAAIPPSERGAYAKDFFPVAGDSAQAVKDKAEARKIKMENAKFAAGQKVDYSNSMNELSDEEIDELYRRSGGE